MGLVVTERGGEQDANTGTAAQAVHPRERLRGALLSLGTLSGELTKAEAELEHARAARAEAIEKAAGRELWDLDERAKKQRHQVEADYAAATAGANTALTTAERTARETHAAAVSSAKQSYAEHASQLRKSVQEGEWLADSLLEGAEVAARQHTKEEREALQKRLSELDAQQARAIDTLEKYGQQHLMLDPPPTPVVPGPDVEERHARDNSKAASEAAEAALVALGRVELANAFVGTAPYLFGTALVGVSALVGQVYGAMVLDVSGFDLPRVAIGAVAGGVVAGGLGVWLKAVANRRVRAALAPLRQQLEDARVWGDLIHALASERINSDLQAARLRREEDVRSVRERHAPVAAKVEAALKAALAAAEAKLAQDLAAAHDAHARATSGVTRDHQARVSDLEARGVRDRDAAKARAERDAAEAARQYEEGKAALQARWRQGIESIAWAANAGSAQNEVAGVGDTGAGIGAALTWSTVDWKSWKTAAAFPAAVRFGELAVDVAELTRGEGDAAQGAALSERWRFDGALPDRFAVPAVLAFGLGAEPRMSSLMLDFDRDTRAAALSALRSTTARLLASMPAGRVRLTLIDPVGLGQTFAGFMHLADHDEQLTGPRIWTESEAIDRRLTDLTEHMETVIQKYLRNEFETIDAYNAQAGELAEPYRFLVVADFPTSWSAEALKKLSSILSAGAKCGVHVLLARDTRVQMERRVIEDVRAGTTGVAVGKPEKTKAAQPEADELPAGPRWADDVFGRFPLTLDAEPDDAALTELCKAVGEGARRANRVEVDVRALLPSPEQRWTGSTASEFKVPVGRSGATRLQYVKLGKGVSQHALIAGKTGSGKSTLLHVMVTAAAEWFSPAEVEFYLIDFKKGVEFKAYVDGRLPHVKAVAIESDREFGLSVLQRLDAELTRRGEIYRAAGVQDLAGYRTTTNAQPMPRVILVVDEFQEFFSEDDRVAQESASLIDRLVRQGRAFGMHVVLGSQTIGGSTSLPRATLGQMAVRVALQCSEADSTMILGDSNTAARLLTRPGEAIYNDNGGAPEANSPFQVAWLADERRDQLLADIGREGAKRGWTYDAVVFEGNKPVDLLAHREMSAVRSGKVKVPAPTALLGEPVAIKPATRVTLRRQPGANMLLIGQQEEAAMATLQGAILSLAATAPPTTETTGTGTGTGAKFIVLEGTMAESPLRGALGTLDALAKDTPATFEHVEYRDADAALARVHEELQRRLESPDDSGGAGGGAAPVFVVIYALQRYRSLRKTGDDFSFSMSDEPKKASPDKMLAELAKEGPAVGIHVLAWADTLVSVERVFDRSLMREFDHRVLFQMSASDSSTLIDSPAANRLGQFRALLFSEEQGVMEKFRPFGILPPG